MITDDRHPSKLSLDLALIEAATDEVRAHIQSCARCTRTLETMRSERDAFLRIHPNPPAISGPYLLRNIESPAHQGARPQPIDKKRRIVGVFAVAASIAIALALGTPFLFQQDRERMKGDSSVELWVRRGPEAFRFEAQPLQPDDTLLFRYTSARTHLLVLSAEESGKVQAIVTDGNGSSMTVAPGSDKTAPAGVKLDTYEGRERIIAVLSNRPLRAAPLIKEIASRLDRAPADKRHLIDIGSLEIEGDQTSWHIEKAGHQ